MCIFTSFVATLAHSIVIDKSRKIKSEYSKENGTFEGDLLFGDHTHFGETWNKV